MKDITLKCMTEYQGEYQFIRFTIRNWLPAYTIKPRSNLYTIDSWAHYIYIELDRLPEKSDPASFWLPFVPIANVSSQSPFYGYRDYDKDGHPIIGKIEFHGGCTWYSKSPVDMPRQIKLGCDYQHLWDENSAYDIDYILDQVKLTIDSLWKLMPDMKLRCQWNGKWYHKHEGDLENGCFYSSIGQEQRAAYFMEKEING